MIYGNSGRVQIGLETVEYGTAGTMTNQIQIKSESLKYEPNKKNEGVLTGGKTGGKVYTMSKGASGNLTLNVRPDELGYFLGLAFGVEDSTPNLVLGSTGAYEHTFTPTDSALKSATIKVDRVASVVQYPGAVVNTLAFKAAPEDYLTLDIGFLCKTEEASTAITPISLSPLQPIKFYHGSVKIEGVEVADITNLSFNYDNKAEKLFTTETGAFMREPEVGVREAKMELEVLYSADSEEYRTDYFLADATFEIEFQFISDEEIETGFPYSWTVNIPVAQIQESTPANLSGPDKMMQTLSVVAVDPADGVTDFISSVLVNGRVTAYI